jgi:hypothetical protein
MNFSCKLFIHIGLLSCAIGTNCQSFEKSLSFSNYHIKGRNIYRVDYDIDELLMNFAWGANFSVYSPHKDVTFGINTTCQAGFLFSSSTSNSPNKISADFGLPVAATIRYGAGANKNTLLPVGIGLGFGTRINAVIAEGDVFMTKNDRHIYTTIKPYVFLEIIFDYQKRNKSFYDNFKLQFAFSPKVTKENYEPEAQENITCITTYYNISFIKFKPFH